MENRIAPCASNEELNLDKNLLQIGLRDSNTLTDCIRWKLKSAFSILDDLIPDIHDFKIIPYAFTVINR